MRRSPPDSLRTGIFHVPPRNTGHRNSRSGKQQEQKQFFHIFIGFSGSFRPFVHSLTLTERENKNTTINPVSKKFGPEQLFLLFGEVEIDVIARQDIDRAEIVAATRTLPQHQKVDQ